MNALLFSLSVTAPIVSMLVLGQLLCRCKIFNEEFIQQGSNFLFKICMPSLIFFKMSAADFSQIEETLSLTLVVQAILVSFCLLSWLFSVKMAPQQRGVFVQAAFRSNITIIGLAFVQNSYGERANGFAFTYIAFTTILVNIQSILVLNASRTQQLQHKISTAPRGYLQHVAKRLFVLCQNLWQNGLIVVRNPLIIATCLGLLYSFLNLPNITGAKANTVPYLQWFSVSANYLIRLTLPLALIFIGAKLRLRDLSSQKLLLLLVNLLKLVLLPAFGLSVLLLLKVPGIENPLSFGVIFLMLSSPTAVASFIMAKQMHGDAQLAANIVASTTIFSVPTISTGLLLLRLWQLI